MKTTLKIKPDSQWLGIDIYDELPISVVISQEDITELGSSAYKYSKTFTIPGTKHNNEIFSGFYSVVGIDFDALTKIECVVESGGAIIFEGFLRLNAVLLTNDYIEYEAYILTEISDFSSEIQGLNLNDLDLQDLDHDNNYDNITTSWEYTGGTSGLFNGQILYPFYNYGLIYDTNDNPAFEFSLSGANSFSGASNSVPEEYLKPAIQVKSVLDRVFSATSYSYTSDFFNSDYFKRMYMSLSNTDNIGITREDDDTENRNKFKVLIDTPAVYLKTGPQLFEDTTYPLPFNTLDPDGYDPLNAFTLDDDYPSTSADDYNNYFNVPTSGDYYFNLKFDYNQVTSSYAPTYFRVKAYKSTTPLNIDTTGTLFYQTPGSGYAAVAAPQQANVFFSGALQSNEYVSLYVDFTTTAGSPTGGFIISGFQGSGSTYWDLYTAPTLNGTTNVNLKLQMPELSASDFMNSLIKMFNLTIQKDETEKVLKIEPWNNFYNDGDRLKKDWTDKVDRDNTIRVEPLDFNLSKDVKWTYESAGDEFLGKYYENNFDNIFGNRVYTASSNILTGEQELEIPYRPFPTNTIPGSDYVVMGKTCKVDDNGLEKAVAGPPHLFFWVGNRYMWKNDTGSGQGSWYLQSGATSVEWNTYPAVNHLSRLDNIANTEFSDLNFRNYWDFFVSNNDVINPYSKFNLYTSFWQEYIENLYSNEARRMEAKFYLEPKDVGELKLNDKIFVKDNYWRIEKIEDADLVNPKLTDISLLKEITGFYDKQPPAPNYDDNPTPNQSYPSPSPNTLSWYFENLLGSYSINITQPNLQIRQVSTSSTLVNTFAMGSGSVGFYSGNLRIIAGFTYRNYGGSINDLEITFGSSSGDDSYGRLAIPQPGDNAYYELDITQYFPASGNLYATIDTY